MSIINFFSKEFQRKGLCDGLTFNLGRACGFSCSYCYVDCVVRKLVFPVLREAGACHQDIVIRLENALEILRDQLVDPKTGKPRFLNPLDTRVIYSSTLVDIAACKELMRETAQACCIILANTHWQIRLLTKSNLLPELVGLIPEKYHSRLILGVSTGTLDDKLARSIECGCPVPSKRLASLHWLQDNGFRTFGMLCPSLPQTDYQRFAREMADAIRVDRCEYAWAEVINVRGAALTKTVEGLRGAGFSSEADMLAEVSGNRDLWTQYAWDTFRAYTEVIPSEKFTFLQY